jgi:UDP-glucose 4-epimerase
VGKPIKNWDNGIAVRYSGTVRAEDPFNLLADDTTFRRLAFDWRIPVGWGVADHVSWFKDQIR